MKGRKKLGDTSERVVRAQICLKPSQLEWLKQQGGISSTISKLVTEKINMNIFNPKKIVGEFCVNVNGSDAALKIEEIE